MKLLRSAAIPFLFIAAIWACSSDDTKPSPVIDGGGSSSSSSSSTSGSANDSGPADATTDSCPQIVTTKSQPVNMAILLERAGSMADADGTSCGTKWSAASSSLNAF